MASCWESNDTTPMPSQGTTVVRPQYPQPHHDSTASVAIQPQQASVTSSANMPTTNSWSTIGLLQAFTRRLLHRSATSTPSPSGSPSPGQQQQQHGAERHGSSSCASSFTATVRPSCYNPTKSSCHRRLEAAGLMDESDASSVTSSQGSHFQPHGETPRLSATTVYCQDYHTFLKSPRLSSSSSTSPTSPVHESTPLLPLLDLQHPPHVGAAHGSTLPQTIFNLINVMVGLGILTLPLTLRMNGWVWGCTLIVFCGIMTRFTAFVLTQCMDVSPTVKDYPDIGELAFGRAGRCFITTLFFIEIFLATCSNMMLIGDNLRLIYADVPRVTLQLYAFCIVLALCMVRRLAYISYASLSSIIAVTFLYAVMLYTGLTRTVSPGSLWEAAETHVWPPDAFYLPLPLGYVMFCYSGHAVIPTIYKDMRSPYRMQHALNISFGIVVVLFVAIGVLGYWMFGDLTASEVTWNIKSALGDSETGTFVANLLAWSIIVNPVSKYPLLLNPIFTFFEENFLRPCTTEPRSNDAPSSMHTSTATAAPSSMRFLFSSILLRTAIVTLTLLVAMSMSFGRMVMLVGSFCSFTASCIFPCLCYLKLFGGFRCKHVFSTPRHSLSWATLVVSILFGVIGTIWLFLVPERDLA